MAVHLVVAGEVFDCVSYFVLSLLLKMYWMRSGTEFSQFLRIFLPTLQDNEI